MLTSILTQPHVMQCMEVWGGNRAADSGVVMPGLDVWVYSLPYDEDEKKGELDRAGGDVHFVSSCGTGRISRLILADVSGHGTKVAAVAMGLRTLMRRYMNYLDQTTLVQALNRAFTDVDQANGRFATSIAMTFFAPTARLDLCNAGHPRPLWFRASKQRWELLVMDATADTSDDITNLPLGILGPTRYEEFGIQLGQGDLVIAYTDAVTESRSSEGELLGETGLLQCMSELDARRPESIIPSLLAKLDLWRGGVASDDDVTVLLVRHNGTARQAPLMRRLTASVRFLGALLRNCIPFGERPPIPWPEARMENLLGPLMPSIERRWRVKGK